VIPRDLGEQRRSNDGRPEVGWSRCGLGKGLYFVLWWFLAKMFLRWECVQASGSVSQTSVKLEKTKRYGGTDLAGVLSRTYQPMVFDVELTK
jgi:hypothetical protein